MSTDPGIWGWTGDIGQLGFTVTFSLGLTPAEVLTQYGVEADRAELLTRGEAWARYPPNYGGAQLRVGTLGRWGFCFEEAGFEGIKPRTLSGLSADTETLAFFTAGETSSFIYLKDGEGVEAFEPGLPETVLGDEPCRFWADTQKILALAPGRSPEVLVHAVLQAIAKHVRGLLDRRTLEGPLLTGFLADADRAPTTMPDDGPASEESADAPDTTPAGVPTSAYPAWLSPAFLTSGPLPITKPGPGNSPGGGFNRISGQARAS